MGAGSIVIAPVHKPNLLLPLPLIARLVLLVYHPPEHLRASTALLLTRLPSLLVKNRNPPFVLCDTRSSCRRSCGKSSGGSLPHSSALWSKAVRSVRASPHGCVDRLRASVVTSGRSQVAETWVKFDHSVVSRYIYFVLRTFDDV